MNSVSGQRVWSRALGIARYATALLAVGASAAVYAVLPEFAAAPTALFMIAVAAVAAVAGCGPALVAAGLSALLVNALLLPKDHAFPARVEALGIALSFFVVALTVASLAKARRAAERAQSESEERLRAFHEASLDGFMVFKAIRDGGQIVDFEYAFANPAALRIVGNGSILGRRLLELYPSHGRPGGLFERYVRVVETGEPHDIEFLYEGEDIRGWFRNMSVKMGDGVAMVFSDITDRKEAEETQRLNEQRFRAIFDRAGVGIVEVAGDDHFIAVNDRACEILGYPREKLLAMNVHELTWPEDRPLSDHVNAQIHNGVSDRIEYEKRYRKADGSPLWAHVTVSAIRDQQGNWIRSITTILDITERMRAQEALRMNEARLRAVFNALVEGIVFLNPDGEVMDVNDAVPRTHGHTLAELSSRESDPRERIIRPDGTPFPVEDQPAIVALRTGQAVRDVEMGVPTLNGDIRWRLVNAQPVCDDRGNLLGAVASFYDITDRKKAEEALRTLTQVLETRVAERTVELERTHQALRQSERLATLGQAMAILSHENRNALQNSLAALQMLRRTLGENEKQHRYVNLALSALEGLRHAYEDIRQYAAPMKLEKAPASMEALWRATWTNMAPRTAGRDVRLLESCSGDGSACEVDHARFQQVFRNLIENSLDACTDPVEIQISCEETTFKERPALRIIVRDNGPGMNPAEAQRVMEPFFTTKAKGTGIGLAVVRRIVEAHDGRIAIETAEGKGFGVVMEVPRSDY